MSSSLFLAFLNQDLSHFYIGAMLSQLVSSNVLESSILITDDPLSHHGVSLNIPPLSAPSVPLPSPQSLHDTGVGYTYEFTGHLPAAPFLLMKENIPPSKLSSHQSSLFDPPSYDSFFSTIQELLNNPPTSYDGLWNSTLFQSSPHATLSPIRSYPFKNALHPSSSSVKPSVSFASTKPSVQHSSILFSDSDTDYSSSSSPQFIMDVSMDIKRDSSTEFADFLN
jgi:hypothetical protein